jgi:hypothetical protein
MAPFVAVLLAASSLFSGMINPKTLNTNADPRKAEDRMQSLNRGYPWYPLDKPLCYLDRARKVPVTFKRLCQNVGLWAGTDVGKTSAVDATLSMAAIAGGASLLTNAPKFNSAEMVRGWTTAVGREKDFRLIGPGVRFNVWQWLLKRRPERMAVIREVVDMVRELTTLANRGTGLKVGTDHPFFSIFADKLNAACCTVDLYANNSISVETVLRTMQTIPQSRAEARHGKSFCKTQCEKALRNSPIGALPEVKKAADFLMIEMPGYDSRLRGDCLASALVLWSSMDRFPLSSMFAPGQSDLTPTDLLKGGIFVVNMPLAEGNEGLIATGIWKMSWMKACLDRCGLKDQRPSMLLLQEAQEYVTAPSDFRFVPVCREASACYYYSSQSVATVVALIGQEAFDALAACLTTQIFCNNTCTLSNEFASGAFGQYLKKKITVSGEPKPRVVPRFPVPQRFRRQTPDYEDRWISKPQLSASLEWEPVYRPEVFLNLQRGGGKDALVEARVRMMSEDKQKPIAHECYFNQNLYTDPFREPGGWCRGKDIVTLS